MEKNKTKYLNNQNDLLWKLYLWFTAILVLFGIFFNMGSASAQEIISIKDKVIVEGSKIFFKDIADTKNPLLKDIFIGKSPRASRSLNISGYKIASILRSRKIPENITIEVPQTVLVKRDFQVIKTDVVEKVIRELVISKIKNKKFDLSNFKLRGSTKYPKGVVTFKPYFRKNKLKGNTTILLDVRVNGISQGKLRAVTWINRYESAVFANRNLKKNSIIAGSDLILKSINISKYRGHFISDVDEVIGQKLKRSLMKGVVIQPRLIEKAPLISKGSVVRLVATSGNLVVETIGKAQNDGFKGETILVRNISSKKIITCKVVNKSTVEAFF